MSPLQLTAADSEAISGLAGALVDSAWQGLLPARAAIGPRTNVSRYLDARGLYRLVEAVLHQQVEDAIEVADPPLEAGQLARSKATCLRDLSLRAPACRALAELAMRQ